MAQIACMGQDVEPLWTKAAAVAIENNQATPDRAIQGGV